ncbi:MAG TPA: TerB family tellurite resistance protein [Alphaproteobacteria bacterium]|nr:TerB family tellurite resistance protein [Alphaproteobacteria bacterium]
MSIWGKIIGGAAGFALGGPLGALIGALAGHAIDRMSDIGASGAAPSGAAGDGTRQIAFTIAVIALGAKMAKADGVVTRDEVAAFKRVFQVPPEEAKNVARVFDLAKRDVRGFEPYAQQVARLFRDNPAVLEELLDCLFLIARADGHYHAAEKAYLERVAQIFGFDEATFRRIEAENFGPDKADPYSILGVARDAAPEAIKAAYRKLIRENHPDKLIAEGLPEEFVGAANDRMAAINDAYDRVSKERGIR